MKNFKVQLADLKESNMNQLVASEMLMICGGGGSKGGGYGGGGKSNKGGGGHGSGWYSGCGW